MHSGAILFAREGHEEERQLAGQDRYVLVDFVFVFASPFVEVLPYYSSKQNFYLITYTSLLRVSISSQRRAVCLAKSVLTTINIVSCFCINGLNMKAKAAVLYH